ncbi:protein transport protein Sec61 subunit alpha-like [Triticum dicoccoides]|uniref:protein transport protein Sec61 subunit alpha-like n=1 Tax=Triticum dicoccoides TaxID=85692 RepID=UPI000E7CFF4B|nr:protein transport protein Sec61 subunit alpha-like [Triticum dicoccoides]XP_037467948.1 protein transport protein Sec61 subunit alpha-like [Triticum dicoccoides]XP_044433614.1 protein transport protein Sec61 subunit alpha-like isoform X2 [Triticum aestivum]
MADRRLGLPNLALQLVGILPEVQRPSSTVPHRQKLAYTAVSLLIYLVGSQLHVYGYGVRSPSAAESQYWVDMPDLNSVMCDGIMPLVLSEMLLHLLLRLKVLRVNNHEDRTLLNRVQKFLGVVCAAYFSICRVLISTILGKLTIAQSILIVLQHFFGCVIIIYVDDLLKKGYGFLSSIPLFSATDICASIFWKAFSPGEGAVTSSIINGNYKLSSMHKVLGSLDLPEMASMLTTCAFFLFVLSLQGFHVMLPVRSSEEASMQMNYAIKLSYFSFAPLLFHDALAIFLYFISELLRVKFGENNKVVNLLGKWKKSQCFGQAVPVIGLAYDMTTPPTLADVGRHPFHTLVCALWQLLGCGLVSLSFFSVCSHSELYVGRLLGGRRNATTAQPDSVPLLLWRCYVGKAAFLVGLCIGALRLLAGLAGVVGSGTGIMLAVTVLYSCFEETSLGGRPAGAFGF